MKRIQYALIFVFFLPVAGNAQFGDRPYLTDSIIEQEQRLNKKDFKTSLITSSVLVGGGLIALSENVVFSDRIFTDARNRSFPEFQNRADDFLALAPAGAVYGLNMLGVQGRHSFGNRSLLLAKSEIILMAIVYPMKLITGRHRPDQTEFDSFPSGHTAHAFMTATFMHKEYGGQSRWYSIAAYSTATTVAVMRVLNNRHFASDVLVGAGIGIFSTQLAYLTHQYRWFRNDQMDFTFVPSYTSEGLGLYVGLAF